MSDTKRQPFTDRLDSLAALSDNWDSYGARPPRREAIELAKRVARIIPPNAHASPTPDGNGVAFEWTENGVACFVTAESFPDDDAPNEALKELLHKPAPWESERGQPASRTIGKGRIVRSRKGEPLPSYDDEG